MDKHFLSVMAIFKNESHILDEWLTHYINEGVDHFYLIDHNSTDNYLDVIHKYLDKISLIKVIDESPQISAYNNVFNVVQSEWTLICDLDEFVYSRNGYDTISNFLDNRGKEFNQIIIPSVDFHNGGHKEQPDSVVDSFTVRTSYYKKMYSLTKSIVRNKSVDRLNVHGHRVVGKTFNGDLTEYVSYSKISPLTSLEVHRKIDESDLESTYLKCNHYRFQSEDYYFNNKSKRGDIMFNNDAQEKINYWEHNWIHVQVQRTVDDVELIEKKTIVI